MYNKCFIYNLFLHSSKSYPIFLYHIRYNYKETFCISLIKLLPLEKLTKEYQPLSFEAFKQLYETDKTLLLLNESIWKNTLKELMTEERVTELLTRLAGQSQFQ